MYSIKRTVLFAIVWVTICGTDLINGQNYLITGPADTQFIPSYQQEQQQPQQDQEQQNDFINPHTIIPFRQIPQGFQKDSYFPQRADLQTSDLPLHLQQTLPQYRYTTKEPPHQQFHFQNSAFRPSGNPFYQNIIPSTHRPNYSHLFGHNRGNPAQTETFLGEITIQNPVQDFAPQFNTNNNNNNNFLKPQQNVNKNPAVSTKNRNEFEKNRVELASRGPSFLNHRTRIIAPDTSSNKPSKVVKDYFVNTNGDVFSTTKPLQDANSKKIDADLKSTIRKPNIQRSKNTFALEGLLEDPIKNSDHDIHDDKVEIVKSIEKDSFSTTEEWDPFKQKYTQSTTEQPVTLDQREPLEDEYEDEDYPKEEEDENEELNENESDDKNKNNLKSSNDLNSNDYLEEENEEDQINHEEKQNNSTYDVVTMKPSTMVKDDNFKEFIDTTVIDNSTEDAPGLIETTTITTEASTKLPKSRKIENEDSNNQTNDTDLVVNIVTTKSVINNTLIADATPLPPVTEHVTIRTNEDNTTDTWVVIASVQTSRSVSGAHFLPSGVVEQDERVDKLNEKTENQPEDHLEEYESNSEEPIDEDQVTIAPSTTIKAQKSSTESLLDKLDRVQSDLSSGLLTGQFKNITVIEETTTVDNNEETTTISSTTSTTIHPQVSIRKYSPSLRKTTTPKSLRDRINSNNNKDKEHKKNDLNSNFKSKENSSEILTSLLPANYKPRGADEDSKNTKLLQDILNNARTAATSTSTTIRPSDLINKLLSKTVVDDISKFLPPGYKPSKQDDKEVNQKQNETKIDDENNKNETKSNSDKLFDKIQVDDVSHLLPPGYKVNATNATKLENPESKKVSSILSKAKPINDISSLLPPGYKPPKEHEEEKENSPKEKPNNKTKSSVESLLKKAQPVDISAFLPPGYKPRKSFGSSTTTESGLKITIEDEIPSSLLPPGYKQRKPIKSTTELPENHLERNETESSTATIATTSTPVPNTTKSFKVVFPSRPGSKKNSRTTTTHRPYQNDEPPKPTVPTIHKGWPSRATTEFTGWPTPSTTPISIEKLLEAARMASTASSASSTTEEVTFTSTTTTTTTTTPKPTTPGVCMGECDLVGTIKLVGGAKWVPELLDRNTKEWQILANEVQAQLDEVFSKSKVLNKWYRRVRIDGFSKGSVLVDYLVELNDLGRQVNTQEMKKIFHESLSETMKANSNREGKALNDTEGDQLTLGNFIVDPKYTDFIVLPKEVYPTVGYAEDNVLLPQWAIAVIVIGLASLLFVIIFGVTVLVNRQKNAKKKAPIPLTEDMLNELNKNHMGGGGGGGNVGGFDNYGADVDLYNMDDVWNDRSYESKPKKQSSGSIHDNSMSNLYDSWRSEWNGYYYNGYYGNHPGSSTGGYGYGSGAGAGRRRSDYDTNF